VIYEELSQKTRALQALAFSLLLLPPMLASAVDQPTPKPTDVPATVIAHLPLPQATGSQMLLQKEEGKQYLYVQQAAKQGFMVVDVSKPEKPSLLKRTAESNQSTRETCRWLAPMWRSRKLRKKRRRP
jgi:hypothetical protein